MKKIKYKYWLGNIDKIGAKKTEYLLNEFGSAKAVYDAKAEYLNNIKGISKKDADIIIKSQHNWNLESEYEKLLKTDIKFITKEDLNYPIKMREQDGMPYGIYVKGRLPAEDKINVAIVGARNCSIYGRKAAENIGKKLSENDIQIISGLAKGIDSSGHKGAINESGSTFAVMGCGADICYPRESIELYMNILSMKGGIISEQPPKTQPFACYFPMRNRIISALSDIVIIIEAKEKSGSLITADFALEQGKEVMAVPGRVNDELSRGCNMLIKQGADIVCSFEDINETVKKVAYLRNIKYKNKINNRGNCNIRLEKKELMVYSCLGLEPKNIELILNEVPLTFLEIINILLDLQIRGYIEEIAKNNFIVSNLS